MFEFFYKKNNNNTLFKDFENIEFTNMKMCQNYVPIYSTFFSLNDKNWNSINLNNSKIINGINTKINENTYTIHLKNNKLVKSFFKFSPLIDPIKYMYGKYKGYDHQILMKIPTLKNINGEEDDIYERITRKNNVSYVDSFFSYLSSKIKQEHGFSNAVDFYGSFLGIKNNFNINIYDDLEYLTESNFFYENTNKLFKLDENFHDLLSNSSRKNKRELEFEDDLIELDNIDKEIPSIIDDLFNNPNSNGVSNDINREINKLESNDTNNVNIKSTTTIINLDEISLNDDQLIFEFNLPKTNHEINENNKKRFGFENENENENIADTKTITDDETTECSSSSSRTSQSRLEIMSLSSNKSLDNSNNYININDEEANRSINEENFSDHYSTSDDYSTVSEELVNATINSIPVQVICLENMKDTLDSYMNSYDVHEDEWKSILLQIIFTLITYQKAFDFTHNDLHTNNIMYIETDEDFLFYKYKHEYFKVPTFGKIWKIIDYGRAIYTFKGKQIISDSYHKNEDAGTQYNFGIYYESNKPIIEPNKSFDLCRLGCSLFDYFFDSIEDVKTCDDELCLLISNWCSDDNNKNVLYKSNGNERYPGFKLYKMIARNVHNHTPEKQLTNKLFTKMKVKRRVINNTTMVIDIDRIPSYT